MTLPPIVPSDCTHCSAEQTQHGRCRCVERVAELVAEKQRAKLASSPTVHPVVGVLTPVRWPQLVLGALHSGYCHYTTGKVHGLAKVRRLGQRLDLLVIAAELPGRGDGGRFLDACLRSYATVGVWEISSERLLGMLKRRGFRHVREYDEGSMANGMRWDVTRELYEK